MTPLQTALKTGFENFGPSPKQFSNLVIKSFFASQKSLKTSTRAEGTPLPLGGGAPLLALVQNDDLKTSPLKTATLENRRDQVGHDGGAA